MYLTSISKRASKRVSIGVFSLLERREEVEFLGFRLGFRLGFSVCVSCSPSRVDREEERKQE